MKMLDRGRFGTILRLIGNSEIRSHLSCAYSVIEGTQEGKIFVDDDAHPETLLVCPDSGFWFLFGDAHNGSFGRFLPELVSRHLVDKCAVYATSVAWRDALDPLFARKISRIGFEFEPSRHLPEAGWKDRIPPGFTLEPMIERVIAQWPDGLDPWVIKVWGGPQRFASRAFGFCLLHEDQMVSIAAACGLGRGEAEIEVGTVPRFRRRGLARLACTAFVEYCRANRLRPVWSCATGNTASLELGKKLGFVEREVIWGYPLASFRLA